MFSTAAPQLWNTIPEYIINAESTAAKQNKKQQQNKTTTTTTTTTKHKTFFFQEIFPLIFILNIFLVVRNMYNDIFTRNTKSMLKLG